MPIIHLPDPVVVQLHEKFYLPDGARLNVGTKNPAAQDNLIDLLDRADRQGYALELKLVHYEGHPNAVAARDARAERG